MPPTPSAAEILAKCAAVYAACRSYCDVGEQTRIMLVPKLPAGHEASRLPFRTAFVRPSHFFFEYRDFRQGRESEWSRGVVCANVHGVRTWWSNMPKAEASTLSIALAGLAGVSGGTAHAVPRLLLPGLRGSPTLPEARSATLLGVRDLDGRACHVIEGAPQIGRQPITTWIDCETSLLLRLDERKEFNADSRHSMIAGLRKHLALLPSGSARDTAAQAITSMETGLGGEFIAETTTVWRPEMDIDIDPAVFELRPPNGAA